MKRKKRNKILYLLFILCTLSLTGCGYKKPEEYSIAGMAVDSITTVCNTDCSMSDVTVTSGTAPSGEKQVSCRYEYTKVANDQGVADARTYHEYLQKNALKVEDFDEASGRYTAYVGKEGDVEGFSVLVEFTNDSYSVTVTDNVSLITPSPSPAV